MGREYTQHEIKEQYKLMTWVRLGVFSL